MQPSTCAPTDVPVDLPRWSPSCRELDDLECLLLGAYPGVSGFLGRDELAAVRADSRLTDGTKWPVPITLQVPAGVAVRVRETGELLLLDEEGTPVASLSVTELWDDGGSISVAGAIGPVGALERGSHRGLRRSAPLDRPGRVLGIAVAQPPYRPQLAQWAQAAAVVGASILLLPLTGSGRKGPVDGPALVRTCLDAAADLDAEVVPVAVPYHGDPARDRMLTALVAGAYGATHTLGPPAAADPDWARALPAVIEPPEVKRNPGTDRWVSCSSADQADRPGSCAEDAPATVARLLARGEPVPSWLASPLVVRELTRSRPARATGVTVLLSGLSGSGKSTIAKALASAIHERSDRTVTVLDGDLVRAMLSSELTFSPEHRDLNVRRIGFVAAQVTRHAGIAVCAPIAPYARSRDAVRAMVTPHGGYLLVHVSTPIEACEARDRKGLYAKARAGLIPAFTGVSDPYEVPVDADLSIDTERVGVAEAVEQILEVIVARGWLTLRGELTSSPQLDETLAR